MKYRYIGRINLDFKNDKVRVSEVSRSYIVIYLLRSYKIFKSK